MTLPDPAPPPAPAPRRMRPSTVGGVAYLLVCATSCIGLAVVAFGPWRRGVMLMGAALVVAGCLRLVLSQHDAGMLRVRRNRFVDVVMLLGVGGSLIALAAFIPDQPGL